jgi:hypothetical protein
MIEYALPKMKLTYKYVQILNPISFSFRSPTEHHSKTSWSLQTSWFTLISDKTQWSYTTTSISAGSKPDIHLKYSLQWLGKTSLIRQQFAASLGITSRVSDWRPRTDERRSTGRQRNWSLEMRSMSTEGYTTFCTKTSCMPKSSKQPISMWSL